jgi:hypothetical protein
VFFYPHEIVNIGAKHKILRELPIMSVENPTLAHFRHFSSLYTNLRSTIVESALQIHPNYAKQTQFSGLQNDVNSEFSKDYEENRRKQVMKKQTQFKANLSKGQK